MSTRLLSAVSLCLLLAAASALHADIYRWDTGEVIPGTEGIEPGPDVQLDHMELEYAWLHKLTLTNSRFDFSNLTTADLSDSILTGADLTGAVVTGADFSIGGQGTGITQAQLESTASYQAKNLQGIGLALSDLTGWDFREQNLTNANLGWSTLTNADLRGANLRNALLYGATGLNSAKFSTGSVYSQWTVFRAGFDPAAAGLTMTMSPTGDLDADDTLDADDVDVLAIKIFGHEIQPWWLPDAAFDMNGDSAVSVEDHRAWVKDVKRTWYGDADLNGEFNSADFVQVFQTGKYEQGWLDQWGYPQGELAGWSEGDWNGDGFFNSDDFITAFQDGGYEQGPRTDAAAVPEPGGVMLMIIGFVLAVRAPSGLMKIC